MERPISSAPSLEESTAQSSQIDVEQPSMLDKDIEKDPEQLGEQPSEKPDTTGEQPVSPYHPSQFPDGGKDAWLCLLGSACCLFCSFGWINCLGVFQAYYQTHQLHNYSPSTIAWIPSLEIFVMFLPGPLVGFFYDNHGPKHLLLFGAFFHVLGIMMTSLCTEYYQFILAQGICSPIGLNCIFQAGTSTVTTWFFHKRGAAYGMMAAGSGLGGIIFPIMASHLIPQIGFGWTMRAIGFMILGMLAIAFLTVKSRLPPRPRAWELNVFLEPFKDIRFVLITISSFLFFGGMFIPINFIEVQATAHGMSHRLAGYLLAVLNAGSIFGRIIPGILADKVGRFNMQMIMSYVAGVVVFALSYPATGNATYITFAALYGFASGAFVSLAPAQMAQISKVEQIGVRIGVLFLCVSFAGLVSNPIGGAILDREHGSFDGVNIYAGSMLLGGAVLFTLTRMKVGGWKLFVRV